ncbi:hypothetical protein ACWEVO_16555, partial [Micromonospora sp. NPDC003776]
MALRMSFDGLTLGPPSAPPTVHSPPSRPVFLDVTGARRRRVRRVGVLVAVASLTYLPMAASALLPGPTAPALPGPLSVGAEPSSETSDQPVPTPSASASADRLPEPLPNEPDPVDRPPPA